MIKYNIPQTLEPVFDIQKENLLISGCSFSRNNYNPAGNSHLITWPGYLRDRLNIKNLFDCSLPGAGNYHILTSTMWAIENNEFDSQNTFVAVMWSGNDRDDVIVDSKNLNNYSFKFLYDDQVATAVTGGTHQQNYANVNNLNNGCYKSKHSRSIENFLYIKSLYHYLRDKKFKFIFLDYMGQKRKVPSMCNDFSICNYLSKDNVKKLEKMIAYEIPDIYSWCLKQDLLQADNFHPDYLGHQHWTDQHLVPYIVKNWNNV